MIKTGNSTWLLLSSSPSGPPPRLISCFFRLEVANFYRKYPTEQNRDCERFPPAFLRVKTGHLADREARGGGEEAAGSEWGTAGGGLGSGPARVQKLGVLGYWTLASPVAGWKPRGALGFPPGDLQLGTHTPLT